MFSFLTGLSLLAYPVGWGEGKVGERDPQVSRTRFIVGPWCSGNGCVYSGFCSWRALKMKEKTCAMETGRSWLDAGGPSLAHILLLEKEAGGWGGGENSSSQQSICMPQARNFHTATFSGQGHPQSSQDRQQEVSRRQETQPWQGKIAVEAASFPHLHPSTECALF